MPGPVSVKLALIKVLASIASLKVAVILVLSETAEAPVVGTFSVTVGRVVSVVSEVENCQTKAVSKDVPLLSITAVVIVALHTAPVGRLADGVKLATRLAGVYETAPTIGVNAGQVTKKVKSLMLADCMSLLNVAVILLLVATPLTAGVLAIGTVAVTVGSWVMLLPPPPRIGSAPLLQPAIRVLNSAAVIHAKGVE